MSGSPRLLQDDSMIQIQDLTSRSCDFADNTASIIARRSSFSRRDQTQFLLPVVLRDSGTPALSSTSTLSISVCSCQPAGHCPSGGVKALALSMGVSLQTLLGLAVCLLTLTGNLPVTEGYRSAGSVTC